MRYATVVLVAAAMTWPEPTAIPQVISAKGVTQPDAHREGVSQPEGRGGVSQPDGGGVSQPEEGADGARRALRHPLVVIDPGHGGSNTGAPAAVAGIYEKRVTLGFARELVARLRDAGVNAVLTHDDDRYLTLRERARVANRLQADLFLSLHANASPDHAQRGFETYLLTPDALDTDARALRGEDGPVRQGVSQPVARLLDDLERGAALPVSAELAAAVQRHLREVRGGDHDRGVRQAAMDVLYGANMPAVLVEVGFIDHPVEGPELLDARVRAEVVGALAIAIEETLTGG